MYKKSHVINKLYKLLAWLILNLIVMMINIFADTEREILDRFTIGILQIIIAFIAKDYLCFIEAIRKDKYNNE